MYLWMSKEDDSKCLCIFLLQLATKVVETLCPKDLSDFLPN